MENVFTLTGIGALIAGISLGLLVSWLMDWGEKKGWDQKLRAILQ